MIDYEQARDDLVQCAADITHAVDSRNQNGVVAGVGGAAAATGAGLMGSSLLFTRDFGFTLILIALVVFLVSTGRAALDWTNANRARRGCNEARSRFLKSKQSLMETCPHDCLPAFVDVPCL